MKWNARLVVVSALVFGPRGAWAQELPDEAAAMGLPAVPVLAPGMQLFAAVSAADLDGDGRVDLVHTGQGLPGGVYRGREGGFGPREPLSVTVGVAEAGHVLFDADGDGDLDLFVAREGRSALYDNRGGALVDASERLPDLVMPASVAVAADLDGDGDLDLAVGGYIERPDLPLHRCAPTRVLENVGGCFVDRTEEAGLAGVRGCTLALVAADVDADLDLDLIAVNDFARFVAPLALWRNDGPGSEGFVGFTERGAGGLDGLVCGMGLALADLDGDDLLEAVVTNIGAPLAYRQRADGGWDEATDALGIGTRFAADGYQVTWSARFEDLDGDGHLDLLMGGGPLATGPLHDNREAQRSVWLRGAGGRFAPSMEPEGFPEPTHSARDLGVADLDGDGRVELLAAHSDGRLSVYALAAPAPTRVALRASTTGSAAGARVGLRCGEATQTRHVSAGGEQGEAPRDEVRAHLPGCVGPVEVEVRWPSGFVQAAEVAAGGRVEVREPAWLALAPDGGIEVDLRAHRAGATAVEANGAALVEVEPGRWRGQVEAGARLALVVDGVPWGAHPRAAEVCPAREEVAGGVDPARSELVVSDAVALGGEAAPPVALVLRLRAANGAPAQVEVGQLVARVDGSPRAPDRVEAAGDAWRLVFLRASLPGRATLQVEVGGVPLGAPVEVATVATRAEVGAAVDLASSRCALVEPFLRADGRDRGSVYVRFRAAGGEIGDELLVPRVHAEHATLGAPVRLGRGWSVPVTAGEVPGEHWVEVALEGMAAPLRCALPLWAPGPPVEVVQIAGLAASAEAAVGAPVALGFRPLGPDGRAVGSGARVLAEVVGEGAVELEYLGYGRWQAVVAPAQAGPLALVLRTEAGVELARAAIDVAGDVGPEPVEAGPEEAPEVTELEVEVVEAGPEAEAVEVEDVALVEVAEPGAPDAEVEGEPEAGKGGSREGGCAGGGAPGWAWGLLAAWASGWCRRARPG